MCEKRDRPTILISRCLEFDACRYDGQKIPDDFVRLLKKYVHFLTVCPEVEIGLGTPRDTIRIEKHGDQNELIQPKTGRNLSGVMHAFANERVEKLPEIDGVILKAKSPSCGLKGIPVYKGTGKTQEKTSGFFAAKVKDRFGKFALEDEGRLNNARIREHFLTKLFTVWSFRTLKEQCNMKDLVRFQSENKYLFMSYNQAKTTELGRIVGNQEKRRLSELFQLYEVKLYELLEKAPPRGKVINALQHILGYFSKGLNAEEKEHFLELLDDYRNEKVTLNSVNLLLRSWILRFNQPYLKEQRFFKPFPDELMKGSQLERKVL
jgi:uncharacterized protein YbgA (DUF1722 family)/uncharacterized protein YbbK (DUF523 family)